MTNLEQLKETLTALGINFEEVQEARRVVTKREFIPQGQRASGAMKDAYRCEEGTAATVIAIGCGVGYSGFEAVFYFDGAGKFLSHAVYE